MRKPIVNPVVLISPVEDGYVAYDPSSDQLHRLNPLASLIVELCNGQRSVDEIRRIAAPLLPEGAEVEIDRWIDQAVVSGVLTLVSPGDPPVTGNELTVKELTRLADRLREAGKVQTAFICQQRAAELRPDDPAILRSLGELAHIVGQRETAREVYERYVGLEPEDAEIQHLLVSLRDDTAPSRVPDECIKQLYHRFSSFYESNMCDDLGYQGPQNLVAAIREEIGERRDLSVLDLGCGTGLAGLEIQPLASRLVGIDLSPEMIGIARQRKIYDSLEVAEVTDWLTAACETQAAPGGVNISNGDQPFDLIIACDTLIYFGDLSQVIVPALRLLKPGGLIAFSVESAEQPPYHLTDSGRYVHHVAHIENVARNSGLLSNWRESFLRMEYGREVMALYVVLTTA